MSETSIDACREAMNRVLASTEFSRAGRLSSFLRYVCTATLEQKATKLTEQHIGVEVFGRPAHYLPADDTIVRTTAGLLRKRLAKYYENEGNADTVRIAIPRGSYVPVFAPCPDAPAPQAGPAMATAAAESPPGHLPAQAPAPAAATPTKKPTPARWLPGWRNAQRLSYLIGAGVVVALGFLAFTIGAGAPDPARSLWASIFRPDRDTLLVPADSELVMYQTASHREMALDDYIAKRFASVPDAAHGADEGAPQFHARRYTAATSVSLAAELGKLAGPAAQRFHVRFARDLQLDDLKHANAILVGIRQANPWVHLFRERLNFHIDWDPATDRLRVRNDHPLPGEQALYAFSGDDTPKTGFALIAYTRNLGGNGHVLLVGGTSAAGTEAAIDFLLNHDQMRDTLQHALRPDGALGEFEILLQCTLQASGSTDVKIIGQRIKSS